MADRYDQVLSDLRARPQKWLVTGAAGFIGSHLAASLLDLGQKVVVLDNFATGHQANIDEILAAAPAGAAKQFRFIEGDIRDRAACDEACAGVDRVLHQAALGSVPRSIDDPMHTHTTNVDGFVNMLLAARDANCASFAYASSSSVYGGEAPLPAREDAPFAPKSPYASSKCCNEVLAAGFAAAYNLRVVGLRYFNMFGPRQDPNGAYAAVSPRWMAELTRGVTPTIFGDGLTSRDFCPVANAVQANILAAMAPDAALGRNYNIAAGGRATLNDLYGHLRDALAARGVDCAHVEPNYADFRAGDVKHSQADLTASARDLGYAPTASMAEGLAPTVDWFMGKNS
jgi:UDP-N-acetylglucosamine 4-epimerase